MDAIVFIIFALILVLKPSTTTDSLINGESDVVVEDITRVAKLNDSYYEDPNAFCEMINELGFPKE